MQKLQIIFNGDCIYSPEYDMLVAKNDFDIFVQKFDLIWIL